MEISSTLVLLAIAPGCSCVVWGISVAWLLVTGKLRTRRGVVHLGLITVALFAINFLLGTAVIQGVVVGGDAFHGKVEGDRYFLGLFGEYIEVDRATYWFSYWYTLLSALAFFLEIVPDVVEIENGGSSGSSDVARTTFDQERRNRHEEKVHETR